MKQQPTYASVDLAGFVYDDDEPEALTRPRSRARRVAPLAAALLGAVGLVGAGVWRMSSVRRASSRRKTGLWLGAAGSVALLALARWQLQRVFNEMPRYEVEKKLGPLEVRRYPSMRVVDTVVDASWDDALQEGFRRLAGFIFGNNDRHQKIAMTSPVLGSSTRGGEAFKVTFVLPEGVQPPSPGDSRVAVREMAPRRVAVLRFHGRYDAEGIEAGKRELAHALAEHGLHPRGEATFAGYDPPSTLPLLRRTELWVELEERAAQA